MDLPKGNTELSRDTREITGVWFENGEGWQIGPRCTKIEAYDENGQMINGTMADYLVPMAAEMPDIVVGHIQTPTKQSELGAKGAGEAGTAGAPGALMNALNDALSPFNASLNMQPFTPQRVLQALGKVPVDG